MENISKRKILVTGAKGQLGKKIIEVLGPKYELVLTDSDDMDITRPEIVNEVIGREKPDFIIHGAAYTRVDQAEELRDLCQRVNVDGTENVAKASAKIGATLIYISTDYVFDGKKEEPYTERDEVKPLSFYGLTKYQGEQAVEKLCPNHYILRVAWLFGELPENHPGTNFVETMLTLAKERDTLSIVDDQIGSPTYTGDLVDVIDKIIKSKYRISNIETNRENLENSNLENLKIVSAHSADVSTRRMTGSGFGFRDSNFPYGTYHFSGAGECSWYDFASEIFKQSDVPIEVKPITSDEYPQKAERPKYSYMSKDKIEKAMGIKVRAWQEMLAEYLGKR